MSETFLKSDHFSGGDHKLGRHSSKVVQLPRDFTAQIPQIAGGGRPGKFGRNAPDRRISKVIGGYTAFIASPAETKSTSAGCTRAMMSADEMPFFASTRHSAITPPTPTATLSPTIAQLSHAGTAPSASRSAATSKLPTCSVILAGNFTVPLIQEAIHWLISRG